MSREYVDQIKKIIKKAADKRAREAKVTLEFIDGIFESVCKKIRILEEQVWDSTPVDIVTLQSFFETAKREYLSIQPIKIDIANSLTKPGFETWLTDQRSVSIQWSYLDRYLDYLNRGGRSEKVIQETERSSRDIMGKLGDPESRTAFL